jgi:DNA mismatch repair protein MutS
MIRAAAPFSILFPNPDAGPGPAPRGWPEELSDLNLDQVFDAIVADRREYDLPAFLQAPPGDARAVAYRQAVFGDLESGLSAPVEEFAARMRRMRSHLAAASQRRHRYARASWFLGAAEIYCAAVAQLFAELRTAAIASDGLRSCRTYLDGYLHSRRYERLSDETGRLVEALRSLRYCVRVQGGQVTVSDFHDEPDYSAEVLATFEKFRVGRVPSRLVEFRHDFQNHVQELIVDRLALVHPELFRSLLAHHDTYGDLVDPVVSRFDREVQLYLGYLRLLEPLQRAGLPFCHPEVSPDEPEERVDDTFDLALARKLVSEGRPVVLNDIELRAGERVAVVSGPNQGGKTTWARTFGQLHHLAALGFPVPGRRARLLLADRVLTHFARQEEMEDLHSGLEDELLRVREMLRRATSRSVVVMNESFASTTSDDQLFLGREIIGRLMELGVLAVYVTFIDELSRLGPAVVSLVSTVRPDNPAERTFRVVRRPADGHAYAMVLAEAHGLTYDAIRARLRP